jgi:polysaccharide biosynthesis/export protein
MGRHLLQVMKFSLLLVLLAACSLPRGAPLQSEVLRSGTDEAPEFSVYPVTRSLLPQMARWPGGGKPRYNWPGHSDAVSGPVIAPGDQVDLVIWDSDENSLLTAPGQKAVEMKGVRVSGLGSIFVPYLEKVNISGLAPDSARRKIQRQMEAIIPSAQVQLSVTPGARQMVDLVGGAVQPGSYPLDDTDGRFTVLNLISRGGGVSPGLRNPQVRLTRQGRVYNTSLERLYANPDQDTVLRGRDKVIIKEDPRFFRALGAATKEAIIPFDRETISVLDAVSMIGGLSSDRANPEGVLILRNYAPGSIRYGGPTQERVVFTVDLTTTDGLFSAGEFLISPKDTVLVTESPVVAISTIIGLFRGGLGAATAGSNAVSGL